MQPMSPVIPGAEAPTLARPYFFYSDTTSWLARNRCQGIYVIMNAMSPYVYIGSSNDIARRIKEHFNDLLAGRHACSHLQNAWNKYGGACFRLHVIEVVGRNDLLRSREQSYLNTIPRLYNSSRKAIGGSGPHSEETKRKISRSKQGVPRTAETKRKLSIVMTGKKRSPEVRAKMSAAFKGRKLAPFSQVHRERMSASRRGKSPSAESNLKRSLTQKGCKKPPRSPETTAKWRAKVVGQVRGPLSESHKRLISERLKGRIPTAQEREKQKIAVNDPAYRAKVQARLLGVPKSLEVRRKISATLKTRNQSSTFNHPLQPVLLSVTPPEGFATAPLEEWANEIET